MNNLDRCTILTVPSESAAKHWQTVYWPLIREGMMLRDVNFDFLSGNILKAVLTDKLVIAAFWWTEKGESNIYAIALCSITLDSVTGLKTLQIYGFEKVKDLKPVYIKEGLAALKKFIKSKKIRFMYATVGNTKWMELLLRIDPTLKSSPTIVWENKR